MRAIVSAVLPVVFGIVAGVQPSVARPLTGEQPNTLHLHKVNDSAHHRHHVRHGNEARSIFDALSLLSTSSPASSPNGALNNGNMHSALLQSLKILPDEDGDGLVDLKGQLKLLEDGELIDLKGRVKVGDIIDACVEVEVGDGTKKLQCPNHLSHSGHTFPDGRVRISHHRHRNEHHHCSAYFRDYHAKHGSQGYGARLRAALRRIRELEKELESCRDDGWKGRGDKNFIHTRPVNDNRNDDNNSPTPTWSDNDDNDNKDKNDDDEDPFRPSGRVNTGGHEHDGHGGEGHGKDCKHKNRVRVGTKDNGETIWADVCVDAQVSVGPVYASARASATADVNLEKLSASATATAHVKAKVGDLVDADSKTNANAKVDLSKGQADVTADEKLKVGVLHQKVVDTDVKAKVTLGKPCPEGTVVNALGVCVSVLKDHKPVLPGLSGLRMRHVRR